ncbi:MAG: M20/M25/M40 family metallo-hydrolase [Clostridiales bacterium]
MVNRDEVINDFLDFAKIESLSLNERNIANKVKEKFSYVSDEIYEDDTSIKIGGNAGNIIINIKGDKNVPGILLSAHMDTVGPVKNKKPFISGDFIKTDGKTILGGDDIAGIVSILEAVKYIKKNKIEHGNIQIVISVAEEIGLLGVKNLDFDKINVKYGFVLDSTGDVGGVIIKSPSHNVIKTKIIGKSSHAGIEPEKGINAIHIAANAISKLNMGRIDDETTMNVGVIEGGRAANVVCNEVNIESEIRSLNREKLELETSKFVEIFNEEAKKLGGKVKCEVKCEYRNYEIDKNSSIIDILKIAAKESDLKLYLQSSGGGSDTNIYNEMGIDSVNLNVGADKIHSVEEQIKIEDLVKSCEFVINIIKSIK